MTKPTAIDDERHQRELNAAVERMKTLPPEDVPITLDMILREHDPHLVNVALFVVVKMNHEQYKKARDKRGWLYTFLRSDIMAGITEAVKTHGQEMVIAVTLLLIDAAIRSMAESAGLEMDEGGVAG